MCIPRYFATVHLFIREPFRDRSSVLEEFLHGPATRYEVLSQFKESLFFLNHNSTFINSLLTFLLRLERFSSCIIKAASSANNLTVKLEIFGKSFIYRENNVGSKVEPCGTPQQTLLRSEVVELVLTYCYLSVK